MSRSVLALLAAVCTVTFVAPTAAEVPRRKPLSVTVEKRSIFDLGNVVPVGSLNRYASQHSHASPVYSNTAERYGEGTLPPRIGSGSNPFAGTWSSPRW